MTKFRQVFLLSLIVFLGAVTVQFVANLANAHLFSFLMSPWSTAAIFWDSLAIAVVSCIFTWLIPLWTVFGVGSKPKHVVYTEEKIV